MPLEGLRWSRDSGSALYDTPQNGRSRTGWGGTKLIISELPTVIKTIQNTGTEPFSNKYASVTKVTRW